MSKQPARAYWDILIKLNGALLDEPSFHRRRTIVLAAISELTGRNGHLWLVEDGQPPLETMPRFLQQAIQSGRVTFDKATGQQAHPLLHRQTGQFLGSLAGHFANVPPDVIKALLAQTQLAFAYPTAEAQAWVSAALLQVAEATRNQQTLDDVLTSITRIVPVIAGVDACAIWLRSAATGGIETDHYTLAAEYSFSRAEVKFLQTYTLSGASLLTIRLAVLKQPLLVSPTNVTEELPAGLAAIFAGQTTLFLPLLSQGDLNGLLMMRFDAQWMASEPQLQMMRGIAHQAAAAIQTAQLLEAQQEEAYVSTALLQVAQVVAMQADLAVILETIARITPMLTGVNSCLVFLYQGHNSGVLTAQYGLTEIGLPLPLPLADFSELRAAVTEGRQAVIQTADRLPVPLRQAGLSSLRQGLIIPLGVKEEVVGALMVGDDQPRPPLAGKRKDILTGIAYQTALAVDNARLYAQRARQEQLERELELAREIQTAFIPRALPSPAGWELATFWKMAREVGGDFFDVIPLPQDQLLVVIADVSGKGVPAALFMALTRSLIQATALELNQPGHILARVNHLLLPNNQKNMFVTMFCAIFDLKTGQVVYTSAGHNPPLLVRRSGEIVCMQTQGIVLGILEEVEFEQKVIDLGENEGILFYTDGITEAFGPQDEIFGEARLQEALRAHWHCPAVEIVQALNQTVLRFAGSQPQSDDRTLLLLKKQPLNRRRET